MDCAEQGRLFDQYYDQVSAYFSSVIRGVDWTMVREAAQAAENARATLEKHEKRHGCGKLPMRAPRAAR